jgi:hypothetical protein
MVVLTGQEIQTTDDKGQPAYLTEVVCEQCQSVVGYFEHSEIASLTLWTEPILCFNCDPPPSTPAELNLVH